MDGEPQFLIPSGCLSSPSICLGLLRLFAQSCSAVRILLAHGLPVWQILRSVHHQDEGPDLGAVDRHVCEEAGGVRRWPAEAGGFGRHFRGRREFVVAGRMCCWSDQPARVEKGITGRQWGVHRVFIPAVAACGFLFWRIVKFIWALLIGTVTTSLAHDRSPLASNDLITAHCPQLLQRGRE